MTAEVIAAQRGFPAPSLALVRRYTPHMGESYYAGGQKVELDRDEVYVAVVEDAARRAGLDAQVETASKDSPRRGGGVILAERSALDDKTIASLRDAGALQPVYRNKQAVMVALPEVRVEFDTAEQHSAVMDVLTDRDALPNTISHSTDYGMVVQPVSGKGDDALKIANEIHERGHPAAASVRFIQFVPKPKVHT